MAKGGARPGAGRPKGAEGESTKLRREAKQQFQERVAKDMDAFFNAQKALAIGERMMLFMIETTSDGKRKPAVEVTDTPTIKSYLDGELEDQDREYYFMTRERPDNKAISDMLNRAFGKPDESLDIKSGGEPLPAPILGGISVHNNNSDSEDSEASESN